MLFPRGFRIISVTLFFYVFIYVEKSALKDVKSSSGFINNMKKIFLLMTIATFLTIACGKDAVQPLYDSSITLNAIDTINVIREAYQDKDTATLENRMEIELFNKVSGKLVFEEAALTFSAPRMIRISDTDINILLNWQGKWTRGGRMLKDRGVSTLVLDINAMKLLRVEGTSPFDTPGM